MSSYTLTTQGSKDRLNIVTRYTHENVLVKQGTLFYLYSSKQFSVVANAAQVSTFTAS